MMKTFLLFVTVLLICLFLSCKSDTSNNRENTTPSNTIRNSSNSDTENLSNANTNLENANSTNLFNTNSTNKAANLTEQKTKENKANSTPLNNTPNVNTNRKSPIQNVNSNDTSEITSPKSEQWCYWFKLNDNKSISWECDGSEQACLKYKDEWSYQTTIKPCRQVTKDLLSEAEIACQNNVDIYACKWRDQVKFLLELQSGK